MSKRTAQHSFTAAECARRTGLTVKALRIYEREGLLKPKRTMKDWRIYDAADLARIGEVAALRGLGLRLSDIAALLRGKATDIGRMLELQQDELLNRRAQIDAGLSRIAALRRRLAKGETLSITDIAIAIKESHMSAPNAEAIAWKRYEQMRPRTPIPASTRDLEAVCGCYLLAAGIPFRISMKEGVLVAQIHGQPALQLHAESKDSFFYAEVPAQVTFSRSADGAVSGLTLHQNGVEQQAPRMEATEAEAVINRLRMRAATGTPAESSREMLEALLDGQAAGEPPYGKMSGALAAVVQEQSAILTDELRGLGRRLSITFLAVTPEGWDCYRVAFENGELDANICVGQDGRITGATLEPPRADSFWNRLRTQRQ